MSSASYANKPTQFNIGDLRDYAYPGRLSSIDPAVCFNTGCVAVLNAICSKVIDNAPLSNTGGGNALVPEIATKIPTVANGGISADGLTYTFKLKPYFFLSNLEPITAKTVKASLERAIHVGSQQNGASAVFYGVITGSAAAINDTTSNHINISGITTPDLYTLKIHLDQAIGDFLPRMALSFGCVVSKNTPDTLLTTPFPGSGPYKIAAYPLNPTPGGEPHTNLLLDRNLGYLLVSLFDSNARPAKPDKINTVFGVSLANQEAGVINGTYDIGGHPDADTLTLLATYGTPAVGKPTFASFDSSDLGFLTVNNALPTTRWPFCNPNMRQAVGYAINRTQAIIGSGSSLSLISPTDQFLAPPIPGWSASEAAVPVHNYSGDPVKANQKLAAFASTYTACGNPGGWTPGQQINVTFLIFPGGDPTFANVIKAQLAAFNINVSVVIDDANFDTFFSGNWDINANGWLADYFDAFDYLNNFVASDGSDTFGTSITNYDARLAAVEVLLDPARTSTYSQINLDLINGPGDATWGIGNLNGNTITGPIIPLFNEKDVTFVSARIDPNCLIVNDILGELILGGVCFRK